MEWTYFCEGPDCPVHVRTATAPPYLPAGFLKVRMGEPVQDGVWVFCGWECAMRYAATLPPPEMIEVG